MNTSKSLTDVLTWLSTLVPESTRHLFNKSTTATTCQPAYTLPCNEKDTTYKNLLRKTKGDRDLAERLITYERKRMPSTNRQKLIESAVERLEQDND